MANEEKIAEITAKTGCDPKLASMLFEFTGGDSSGVQKILEALDKDILIFKVRYSANTAKKYGVFLIFINRKTKGMEKFEYLLSGLEEASLFTLKKDWRTLAEDIAKFKADDTGEDREVTKLREKIENKLMRKVATIDIGYLINLKKNNDEKGIKKYFANEVYNLTGDPDVKCEVVTEEIDVFNFYKEAREDRQTNEDTEEDRSGGSVLEMASPASSSATEEPQNTDQSTTGPQGQEGNKDSDYFTPTMSFNTELILSPMSGKTAGELKVGDQVYVKIVESSPSAKYLSDLLNLKKEDGEYRLTAPIIEINETEAGNLHILTELGPNIIGKAASDKNTKVGVKNKENEENKGKAVQQSNAFFYWIIGFIIVIILLMFSIAIFQGN